MWGQGERKSISFLCDFLTIQNWQPGTVFPVHSVCTKDCCFPVAKLCPHELQQARLPCASLFPGVCSNSCSYLENSMERGAWQVTVHGVTRSQTQLGDSHTHTHTHTHACPLSQWYHPTSHPLLLPSILPSIRVFSNESALHIRWPKYWSFSFSISPSNEYSAPRDGVCWKAEELSSRPCATIHYTCTL